MMSDRDSKICPQCGKNNPTNANYCHSCGCDIHDLPEVKSKVEKSPHFSLHKEKRTIITFACIGAAAILLVLFFVMRGKAFGVPSTQQLSADLTNQLKEYRPSLDFQELSIEKSSSEDKEYEATCIVKAVTDIAEYELTAEAHYLKYDQGWSLDYCEWVNEDYKIVNWPTLEDMDNLKQNRGNSLPELF